MFNCSLSKVNFKSLGMDNDSIEKFMINGKVYAANYDKDPEYMDDETRGINISYYKLIEEESKEESNYILAFDRFENVEEEYISEWADEYDSENPYVLEILF